MDEKTFKEMLDSLTLEGLEQLRRALPAIVRRACLRVVVGGKKDDPPPDDLKGDFNL